MLGIAVFIGAIGLSSGEKEREQQLLKFALDLIWLYPFTLGNIATCYLQNCSAKLAWRNIGIDIPGKNRYVKALCWDLKAQRGKVPMNCLQWVGTHIHCLTLF